MFDPYHPELTTVFHASSVEEQDTLMHGREEQARVAREIGSVLFIRCEVDDRPCGTIEGIMSPEFPPGLRCGG